MIVLKHYEVKRHLQQKEVLINPLNHEVRLNTITNLNFFVKKIKISFFNAVKRNDHYLFCKL